MVIQMKKISLIITVVLVVALLSACGNKNSFDTSKLTETTTVETTEKVVKIGVKKADLSNSENFVKKMKEYGAEVSDMSGAEGYWFTFSAAEHEKLLSEKYADAVKKFKAYEDDEAHYIDTIEYDEDFRNMTFNVDRDLYDSNANATTDIVVAAVALSYQIYLEDGQKTNVKVVYSGTDEVISSFTLPMNLSVLQ